MTVGSSAVNARPHVVVDYGPDPHNPGAWVGRAIMQRLNGFLVPAVVGGDSDPELQFHGYGPGLQDFTGAANAGSTTAVRNGGYPDISDALTASPNGDPAARIFADRLRRRGSL